MRHTYYFIGGAKFLRGVFRDAVYPKDIWHRDAIYPRIFCRGVPKIGGVEYPMTPGLFSVEEITWEPLHGDNLHYAIL